MIIEEDEFEEITIQEKSKGKNSDRSSSVANSLGQAKGVDLKKLEEMNDSMIKVEKKSLKQIASSRRATVTSKRRLSSFQV